MTAPAAPPEVDDAIDGLMYYAAIWHTLADVFSREGFPHLPHHLSGDTGLRVAQSLRRAALDVESAADALRELHFAEGRDVGRLDEVANDAALYVVPCLKDAG